MARFNADYWEVPIDNAVLERVASTQALWFETEEDRFRRQALRDFFEAVSPSVKSFIDGELTQRQREVVKLYFFFGKTQEEIAAILSLTQSTVSRHLFGTVRDGRKVGGAITKLKKVIDSAEDPRIGEAVEQLRQKMALSAA